MKIAQLKELVKQVVKEEHEYQQLFKHMLDKSGKDINSMSDDDKKKFFNGVDTAYKAKSEGRLTGYNPSVNELMTYSARSKETGKVVMFKDKEHRDAAIKRGTFTPSENNPKKQSPVSKTKGASVFEAELTAGQKKIDTDGDGEIEGSDLAALRAKNEGAKKKK